MVGLVNHNLKGIVLVSFTYYLVFISVKLFYLLKTGATTEQILYFLCSFTFLLSRALLMSLLAARVHTEAKKPLLILFDVSTQEDSKEVQRFRLQMMYNPIALTGSLFSITRSTILKFFSTIMTYELVLLQLNENQKDTTTVGQLNETLHLP
ncbi:gustatory receptor 5a for trehalose-like [Ostrinia furnacalis]|uniref:gustatory receptor 5a for trehalose-like n=1 Tax=Ostrinia furnacalis TaxID=93504 RepID=UPI00103CA24F|nr:gustatory receptor 5a for trehalose-like [Ostrinia furnacalis]